MNLISFKILCIILILIGFQTACILDIDAAWKNEKILFVNKANPDSLIVEQILDYGATDSEPGRRIVLKDINMSTIVQIDTSEMSIDKWLKLPIQISDYDFKGHYLFDAEIKLMESLGDSIFPHRNLRTYKSVLLPLNKYKKVHRSSAGSKYYYGIQDYSKKFKTVIIYSGGGLVLQTIDLNNSTLSSIELMRKIENKDFKYYKFSTFNDDLSFTIHNQIEYYNDLEEGACLTMTIEREYLIDEHGKIIKISPKEFGKIEVAKCY
ncbi:hypothetical protein GYB29_13110 [bacterium]|nr:hypothetical protein [bacterium]